MKKIALALSVALAATLNAGEIDIDMYGLSYHFNKEEANKEAPRKLDNDGVWVYNPGIGITYDFRKDTKTTGFSFFVTGGWFQDCNDRPFYFGGAGARYRNFIGSSNFMWEANLGGILSNAEDWETKDRETTGLPIASLGIGYKLSNDHILKANFYYVPENNNISATGGTDLIFMQISYAF